jgi:pyrroline-5-carboxylate reductase
MTTSAAEQRALANIGGTVVLVGAGRMGGAMLASWLRRGLAPERVVVLDPQPSPEVAALTRDGVQLNPVGAIANAAAIVIAIKPQDAPAVVSSLIPHVGRATVAVSIMAGRTIGSLAGALPAGTAIVRAMPNTPAAIGRGITVAVPNALVSADQRDVAHRLLAATGRVEWVEDEALLDAVTAVSGSGPAYVFLLAETLARAGVAAGLPAELAQALARETVAGAGELLHRSEHDAATLRQKVTSPGGTTAVALDMLMGKDGFEALLTKAVLAATKRGRDLAK